MADLPIEGCVSTTTSTISATEASSLGTDVQEIKMIITNQEVLPKPQRQSKSDSILDLKRSRKQFESSGSSSKIQPNVEVKDVVSSRPASSLRLAGSLRPSASSTGAKKKEDRKVYHCRHCKGKFASSQALAGHQNAHARERNFDRRGQPIDSMGFGYPHSSFNSYQSLARYPPLHYGSYSRSTLGGIQMPSMANRPYSLWPTLAELHFGNGGGNSLARPGMLNPLAGRVGNPRVQMPSAPRFGGLGATVRSGGGPLPTVISNNGPSNAAGGGRILERARVETHQNEPDEPEEELDLTLRL